MVDTLVHTLLGAPPRGVLAALLPLDEVDEALRSTDVLSRYRVVPWDILKEPSYYHDSIPIHRRLGKYLLSNDDGNRNASQVLVRISNVDVDLSTRANGALELLACINDPAVHCVVLVCAADPLGPNALLSRKSRAQLEAAISLRVSPNPQQQQQQQQKAKPKATPKRSTQRQHVIRRDVALFQLLASNDDIGEAYQVTMQSIVDGIAERMIP